MSSSVFFFFFSEFKFTFGNITQGLHIIATGRARRSRDAGSAGPRLHHRVQAYNLRSRNVCGRYHNIFFLPSLLFGAMLFKHFKLSRFEINRVGGARRSTSPLFAVVVSGPSRGREKKKKTVGHLLYTPPAAGLADLEYRWTALRCQWPPSRPSLPRRTPRGRWIAIYDLRRYAVHETLSIPTGK